MGDVIFVEGVPGAGKSTTAQFLARQLRGHGRRARWIYEEELPNPFVPEMPAAGFATWEAFADAHVARWHAFARDAVDARETIIAESYLLQRPVFSMLRRDAPADMIEALIHRLARAVAELRPRLVHLLHPDPAAVWRATAARRGASVSDHAVTRSSEWEFTRSRGLAGLDGVLAYWRAHGALCDEIVSRVAMETHAIDVSAGTWPERRRQLCTRLGIPVTEPPPPDRAELELLAGRYRDGEREITIALEDGALVLRGVLWASNALLPVTQGVFDVEAWPFQVRFDDDLLRWSGPRLWWGDVPRLYRRVAS